MEKEGATSSVIFSVKKKIKNPYQNSNDFWNILKIIKVKELIPCTDFMPEIHIRNSNG